MSTRSVQITLHNDTDFVLTIDTDNIVINHGQIKKDCNPPPYIDPRQSGSWATESHGVMTGTEGSLRYFIHDQYRLQEHNWLSIEWDDPFVGQNSCRANVSRQDYEVSFEPATIQGNQATMDFRLKKKNS